MFARFAHQARSFLLVLLFSALLLTGCAASRSGSQSRGAEESVAGEAAPVAAEPESPGFSQNDAQDTGGERIVIKDASLTIVVNDPSASMDRIGAMAEGMGGFVVSANLTQDEVDGTEVPRASITVRVPAEKLDEALGKIQEESERLPLNKNISSQDVTAEYTDLQSRLRNLEAAEEQLREMMASANRTEDILNIYQQLVSTREQIEVIKGQIRYYETSARLSSISVDLLANEAVRPLTIGTWQPGGVAKDAIQALIGAVKFLANAAIWIVLFLLPVGLLIVLPLYLLARFLRRVVPRRPVKPSPPPPAPTPQE